MHIKNILISGILFHILSYSFFVQNGIASLIIDNFNYGNFQIVSEWTPPSGPIAPVVEFTETGLPVGSTIGGRRTTWAQKGMDNDIAAATLDSGLMTFTLDNDECQAGVSYHDFGEINLQDDDGIEFDIFGMDNLNQAYIIVNLKLTDLFGNSKKVEEQWGVHDALDINNINTQFDLHNADWAGAIDLAHITGIDICFYGGLDWFNPQINTISTYNSATPVPEPNAMFLFATGLVGLIGTRIMKRR
jgi:hypothetical protein